MNTGLSLIPPFIAIFLAITTRQVVLSLLLGVFAGEFILSGYHFFDGFIGTIELIVRVIADPDNARMLLFSLMIGSLVSLVQESGGVNGFVHWVTRKKLVNSARKAGLLANAIGTLLFLEGSMSILTTGTVSKPLFKKFRLSREKLAYIADSTAAPAKVLIPLNGWGAYLMMHFKQGGMDQPFVLLMQALPFFFYPIAAYGLTLLAILIPFNFGPMKKAEDDAQKSEALLQTEKETGVTRSAIYFLIPVLVLVTALFSFMIMTGNGSLIAGDGSKSILYSIFVTLILSYLLYRSNGVFKTERFVRISIDGMNHLLEVVIILALAFAMNGVCKELRTGVYAAGLLGNHVPHFLIPFLVFIISALISFATGTSWGTFAIMLSIGIPMARSLNLPMPLIVGSIISGGVWGDHCSPISDTTVLSALASDCPLMDHVRTQMPYALLGGFFAAILYLVAGFAL